MLKLNASFSKKVPAEQDYSSKSYHAALEVELSDGLDASQIQTRIHETFKLVEKAVENEINGAAPVAPEAPVRPVADARPQTQAPAQRHNGNGDKPASNRQVKYLLDLSKQARTDLQTWLNRAGVENAYQLTSTQCSAIIDGLKAAA